MALKEHYIIDYLAYKAGRPLKIKELASEMRIPGKEYQSFRKLVKQLIDEGKLVRLRRGRVGVPSELDLVVGEISITRGGFGMIYSDSGEPVVISPKNLFTALDGDKVMVRVGTTDTDNELHGKVIKILKRTEKDIIGVFHRAGHFNFVKPDNRKVYRDVYIANRLSQKALDGERVVVRITHWEEPNLNPEGEVVERIGFPGNPKADMLAVIRSFELPQKFPEDVEREAEDVAALFTDAEIKRRRDFTDEIVYTIDPFDAKDFDDAVSVSKTKSGYRLGVYIADVSFFVREDTPLDREAYDRGTSVYLPGMVIPMLPEKLSNDLCSLKPNRKRLVFAAIMNFDRRGKMLDWEIVDGVIQSRARLAYEEAQDFFDTGKLLPKVKRVAKNLTVARELAGLLQKRRKAEGSLDFDLPEARIVMNKAGEVVELGSRIRLEAHRLVEEFMLAANRAVALHVFRLGQKFLYRVHEKPDMEKLEAFSLLVKRLGYRFPVSPQMKPIQCSRFLDKIKGKPEEELLNELMLRSMKKAVYQPKNIGHFGLAFTHYTHFTSPIRRYPDLIVHRLLRKLENGRFPIKLAKRLDNVLTNVGHHCSETERKAEAAEREAIKLKQVEYMTKHLGDEYTGVISGMLNFGFFVRIDKLGAEGMVRLSSLDDDYYHFDENNFRLVGRRTGRVFRLGDPVSVGIMSVDRIKNEINLYLVEEDRKKPRGRRTLRTSRRKR